MRSVIGVITVSRETAVTVTVTKGTMDRAQVRWSANIFYPMKRSGYRSEFKQGSNGYIMHATMPRKDLAQA